MQLKQQQDENPRHKFHLVTERLRPFPPTSRLYSHSWLRRGLLQRNLLRRAVHHARELSALAAQQGGGLLDPRSEQEVAAYLAWLRGTLAFELADWPAALDVLTHARVAYHALRATLPAGADPDAYSQRLDEIDASLRFCVYRAGGKLEDLAELIKVG